MATSVVNPRAQFFANNGRPLIGGRIHTYVAGSSTRARTYKDAAKAQPNTNPIILDGRGEAQIYLAEGVEYKFVVEDSNGALIYTQEPVYGAVWPNAADWPSDATLSYQYMSEAKAVADSAVLTYAPFDTKAHLIASLPLLTDGIAEVSRDEDYEQSRVRYRVSGGVASFLVNLDQLRLDLRTDDGSSLVNHMSFKGGAKRTIQEKLALELRSAADWPGIDRSGAVPIATPLENFIRFACSEGGVYIIPDGDYLIERGIVIYPTSSVKFVISPNARFYAAPGFPRARMFLFNNTIGTTRNQVFEWVGGQYFCKEMPAFDNSVATDVMNFFAENYSRVKIHFDRAYGGGKYGQGDSGGACFITLGAMKNIDVAIWDAEGCNETAIYVTGDSTGAKGESLRAYVNVKDSYGGITSKRLFQRNFIDVDADNCHYAGGVTGVDSPTPIFGGDILQMTVRASRVNQGAAIQGCTGGVVDVVLRDIGCNLAGTPTAAVGVDCAGSEGVLGRVSVYGVNPDITKTANFIGVQCKSTTLAGVTKTARNNHFEISAKSIGRPVLETDSSTDNNHFVVSAEDCSASSLVGLASTIQNTPNASSGFTHYSGYRMSFGGTGTTEGSAVLWLRSSPNRTNLNRIEVHAGDAGESPLLSVVGESGQARWLRLQGQLAGVQLSLAQTVDVASDAEAAAAGVPVGGLYRTGSALKIRRV